MPGISRRSILASLTVLSVIAPFGGRLAAQSASPTAAAKRVALGGYDPVSYFTDGRPEKGSAAFTATFDDATYWFKSAEHRAKFVADPDRFAPQYQGFCAMTVSRGAKAEADPEAWTIVDGKLYVFGAKQGVAAFKERSAGVLAKARENWTVLRHNAQSDM